MQSAFNSLPASASMGRMVSQYLEALDATAVLSAYPDAELIALLELIRGHGKASIRAGLLVDVYTWSAVWNGIPARRNVWIRLPGMCAIVFSWQC